MLASSFRLVLLFVLVFLTLKNIGMAVLLGNLMDLIPAAIHLALFYLVWMRHTYAKTSIFLWSLYYLLILTGVKAGGKTLVILGGNAWEINMIRYGIDLFLVSLGVLILVSYWRLIK